MPATATATAVPTTADLRALAATGLPSTRGVSTSHQPLAAKPWRALVDGARKHRLIGVLAAEVRDGAIAATAAQRHELAQLDETAQSHALSMERLLLSVAATLDTADIQHRVIKGPALSRTAARTPSERTFGDIDIVVHGADLDTARALLVDRLDAIDVLPELRPGFDSRWAKDVMLRVGNTEIDLHRTLAAGPFGLRITTADLFHEPTWFDLGSRPISTLGPAQTLVQCCYNAALGDVPHRLGALRDIALVAHELNPDLDHIAHITGRWRGEAVVRFAIGLTWSELSLHSTELHTWAQELRVSRRDQHLLDVSRSPQRSYRRQLAAIGSIDGLRAKADYLHAIARPSNDYLDARGWDRSRHLSRAARHILARTS